MHVDVGSNVCLVTAATFLHNAKEWNGVVNGTGDRKAKVIAVV